MKCPQCGTYYDEWNPKEGGDIHAYYPRTIICGGCKAKDDAHSAARENDPTQDHMGLHGLQVQLARNPDASRPPSPLDSRIQVRPRFSL